MALKFMGERDHESAPVSAREICDKFLIPFDPTARAMQALNGHGILKSTKGINGGYSLNRSLYEINYLEIMQIVEGVSSTEGPCHKEGLICELMGTCNVSTPLESLNFKVNQFLAKLTLGELLGVSPRQGVHNES